MTSTVWKCEQYTAGRRTNSVVFDSEEQASRFLAQMRKVEPDLVWRMEPVDARMVWN